MRRLRRTLSVVVAGVVLVPAAVALAAAEPVAAAAPATVSTATFVFPQNGSTQEAGQVWHLNDSRALIDAYDNGDKSYLYLILEDNLERVDVNGRAVDGKPITAGVYDSEDPSSRQLTFAPEIDSAACGGAGREDIHDIEYDASGRISRLEMSFAQTCYDSVRDYYGNVVYNEPATAIQAAPSSVDFGRSDPGQSNSAPVQLANTTAKPITIQSVAAPAGYRISANTCTGKVLAPAATCQATVGFVAPVGRTVSGKLAVHYTGGQLNVPLVGTGRASATELILYSQAGDPIGTGHTLDLTSSGGYFYKFFGPTATKLSVSLDNPNSPSGNNLDFWEVTLAPAAGQTLTAGRTYTTQRWPFQSAGYAGLDVSGRSVGCNTSTGTAFLQQYALGGAVGVAAGMDVFFRQKCDGATSSLYGVLRYNAGKVGDLIEPKYLSVTGPHSALGLPTRPETPVAAGNEQSFENGGIFASTGTGAHYLLGAIGSHYGSRGPLSVIGFPTSDQLTLPDGVGRDTHFQHGLMYWSPRTGAHTVLGAILAKWGTLGWERSKLGYPTSDEVRISGGKRQAFQHGFITWNAATGKTTVTSA